MKKKYVVAALLAIIVLAGLIAGSFWRYRTVPAADIIRSQTVSVLSVYKVSSTGELPLTEDEAGALTDFLLNCKVKRAKLSRYPGAVYRISFYGNEDAEFINMILGEDAAQCFLEYRHTDDDYTVYEIVDAEEAYARVCELLNDN